MTWRPTLCSAMLCAFAAQADPHTIPPRKPGAISGSAFLQSLGTSKGDAREAAALQQLLAGNVPSFLRRFVPIELAANGHRGRIWVSPDVLAIGDDDDFVRIPLTPKTAQAVHDCYGTTFVTTHVTDLIHEKARYRLEKLLQENPTAVKACHEIDNTSCYKLHNQQVEDELSRIGAQRGSLVSGVSKDIVLSSKVKKGNVVIYGWYFNHNQLNPKLPKVWERQQGEVGAHGDFYVDYSHGVRLLSKFMSIDGKLITIPSVLAGRDATLGEMLLGSAGAKVMPIPARYPFPEGGCGVAKRPKKRIEGGNPKPARRKR